MQRPGILVRLLIACLTLVSLLAVWPSHSTASLAGLGSTAQGAPAHLLHQQPAVAAFRAAPRAGSVRLGSGLPNSVLPSPAGQVCSVSNDASTPVCSTTGGLSACSTNCDSGGPNCSSIGPALGGGVGSGACSTLQTATGCSVLAPSAGQTNTTGCSALYGEGAVGYCSTLTTQRKQGCSVENTAPTTAENVCSSFAAFIIGFSECSVLATGGTARSFCTAFRSGGDKQCSAFDDQGSATFCSVKLGAKGVCTVLKGAASGQCSLFTSGGPSPTASCSVIGGPDGLDRCVQ